MNNILDMDVSNYTPTEIKQLELDLQTRLTRQIFVKIEILNQNDKVIDEVSGSAIGGNYNIDSTSAIRRTCSITFNLENGYLPSENSIFWINKRFRLYIGLKEMRTNSIYWFNKGTYAIKDPSVSIAINENTISINGLDKMALYNGDIGGQLETAFIADVVDENGEKVEVYVEDAIEALMRDGGETNLLITKTNLVLPYKIEGAIGDTRYDIINKFNELFYNYQTYYNLDGCFVFSEKPAYQSNGEAINEIAMDFSKDYRNPYISNIPYNLLISINRDIAYSNVKNKIVVYGGVHDDGYQPKYEIVISEANSTSPYTVEQLNEKYSDGTPMYRTIVVQDDIYVDNGVAESETDDMETVHAYSINLCKERAIQEVYLHQQATDTIQIVCVPIYSLDVNTVIRVDDDKSGASGEYVITNISCGLGAGDTMSITANKLW
jgi:hypothetical protein